MCVAAAVRGGHSGSGQADVSCASDQSAETNFSGGLSILWSRAQVPQ